MTTKYDWSDVPDEIAFLATDSDGWVHGYKDKPENDKIEFVGEVYCGFCIAPSQNPFTGDWKKSLEQRPGEAQ